MGAKVAIDSEEIVNDLLEVIAILGQPGRRVYRAESVIRNTISKIQNSPTVSTLQQATSYETPIELADAEVEQEGG